MRKPNKFRAQKTEIDGIVFDSKMEARRYVELKLLERAGDISHLEMQPEYRCEINGKLVCKYKADFRYFTKTGRIVEDVKSKYTAKNPVYRIKKKLVEAIYRGTKIIEVQA